MNYHRVNNSRTDLTSQMQSSGCTESRALRVPSAPHVPRARTVQYIHWACDKQYNVRAASQSSDVIKVRRLYNARGVNSWARGQSLASATRAAGGRRAGGRRRLHRTSRRLASQTYSKVKLISVSKICKNKRHAEIFVIYREI